jgi:uncharacterized membrane protein YagU involved in acid resistance
MKAGIIEGISAGLVATAPMTWTLWATDRFLPVQHRRRLPPEQITSHLLRKAGLHRQLTSGQREAAANVAHYAFGAAAGGVLSLAARRSSLPAPATGAVVGAAVWAASYVVGLPVLGIRRSALKDDALRNVQMIAAHLVWGAVAGLVLENAERSSVNGASN